MRDFILDDNGAPKQARGPNGAQFVVDAPLDQITDDTGTVSYYGEAAPKSLTSSAVWRICKTTVSGSVTTVRYAGDGRFGFVWDDRTALVY